MVKIVIRLVFDPSQRGPHYRLELDVFGLLVRSVLVVEPIRPFTGKFFMANFVLLTVNIEIEYDRGI
jgi:hypothetical protein